MATISLRLEDDVKQWLDEIVDQRSLNASAFIREAIEDKLREVSRGAKPRSNFPLSLKERLVLSNQYRILEKLDDENSLDHAKNAKIVEEGYELNYGWMTDHLYEGLSRNQCVEVLDILDLYSTLNYAFSELKETDDLDLASVEFFGFDGNNESKYKTYAQFLVYEDDRYENLKNPSNRILNSHFPSLQMHRARLNRWKKKGQPRSMGAATIRWIIDDPKQ